jgi:uncharacterized coiled-coil protein SlyX
MHATDVLAQVRFDGAKLREQVTALVNREAAQARALRELAAAVEELLELAPKGTHARRLAERVLDRPLAKARMLTAA